VRALGTLETRRFPSSGKRRPRGIEARLGQLRTEFTGNPMYPYKNIGITVKLGRAVTEVLSS